VAVQQQQFDVVLLQPGPDDRPGSRVNSINSSASFLVVPPAWSYSPCPESLSGLSGALSTSRYWPRATSSGSVPFTKSNGAASTDVTK